MKKPRRLFFGMDPASHLREVKYREEDVSVVDVGGGEYGEI